MAHDRAHFAALQGSTNVTWTNNIKQMFTAKDIAHMKTKNIDLSDYTSVSINAVAIYSRVSNGSMPPPGSGQNAWTPDMVNTFGLWIQQGTPQ
jgi:hypothetical protein